MMRIVLPDHPEDRFDPNVDTTSRTLLLVYRMIYNINENALSPSYYNLKYDWAVISERVTGGYEWIHQILWQILVASAWRALTGI
jgi:hypothetical protein